jgi:molecular chaperone DnaK (HSP70)
MRRYLVGIDLGTTHTVVAYVDLHTLRQGEKPECRLFGIEQLIAPGEVAPRPMLPSVRYHPAAGEIAEHDRMLPWPQNDPGIIGELARELGSRVPGRLVTSAKSWLSHRSVDRTEAILPWGAHEDIAKISPVDASAGFLSYVRLSWNHHFPDDPLHEQEIVLTVPASFDEGARALTVEAARIAGLAGIRLIEEPQAACYDWLLRNEGQLNDLLEGVRLVLVCDVGGGTTDFTLIKVDTGVKTPRLSRIAVGDHLMLGGDNMDLALAHLAEGRIMSAGGRLGAASLSQLVQQCRHAKEILLAPNAPARVSVTVVGTGSRLVAGARSTELTSEEVRQMLVEGFYPRAAAEDRPQKIRGGIVEFGLPYAADPAVTRHLAAFLSRYKHVARETLGDGSSESAIPAPDAVLLNGGVFNSQLLSDRLIDVVQGWSGREVRRLDNYSPDLAVARGAVAYGLSRHGSGIRIGAGSARSYFLLLENKEESKRNGVCILARNTEEGREIQLHDRVFSLRLGTPVKFHLASSTVDTPYLPGDLAQIDEDSFTQLPPIAAVLPKGSVAEELQVQLAVVLTEIGTLQLCCVDQQNPEQRWQLEFQLRGGGRAAPAMTGQLPPRFGEAADRIDLVYGARRHKVDARDVRNLRRELESFLGDRNTWDTAALRELFSALWGGSRHRRRSADHERVWLNLSGFCLRPGFGFPLDDWRIQQLWSIYEQGVQYSQESQVWAEWWTLWRRVAGGLDRQAQEKLFGGISEELRPQAKAPARHRKPKSPSYDNMVRLVGGLERIHYERKIEAGEWLLERLKSPSESIQTWWAVGRLGARVPFYGSASNVVPGTVAEQWLEQVLKLDWREVEPAGFAAVLLARMSGDRERDLDEGLRKLVVGKLIAAEVSPSWVLMVEQAVELGEADEKQVFGESLPAGLRLIH